MTAKKKTTAKKKVTAKKKATARKKAPARKTASSKPVAAKDGLGKYSFNILDPENEDLVYAVQDTLESIRSSRKNQPTGFKPMADIRHSMIPWREFMLQWLTGSYGINEGTLIEIMGKEGLGKTSFVYWLMGCAMSVGIPCSYQETEGKPLEAPWALRSLSPDPRVAKMMLQRIGVYSDVFSLEHMDSNLKDWVDVMRGRVVRKGFTRVPMDTPILHIVDTWSKLMSPGEAAGVYDYGDNLGKAKKAKKKKTNEAPTFGHSNWAASWCRKLPDLLRNNNVILVLVQHQNTKIDMGGKPGFSFLSADALSLFNKTKLGGNAFNQNAALQLILAPGGMAKDANGNKIGKIIKVRADKNSYGPDGRITSWILQNENLVDTPEYSAPSLVFHEAFARFMMDNKLMGVTGSNYRYSSKELGVAGVTSEVLKEMFDLHPTAKAELGYKLGISGYDNVVDRIVEETVAGEEVGDETEVPVNERVSIDADDGDADGVSAPG